MLNVRLGPAEEKIVRGLRRRKVNVSALVRRGLHAASGSAGANTSALAELDAILRQFPVARGRDDKRPPLNDRRKMREFFRKKLRRR